MTVAAVMMVRDEQDVIRHTLTHLLDEGVDRIVVADNLSVDDTRNILVELEIEYPDRLVVLEDDEPGYYQDVKATALANYAYKHFGVDWVLPVDADEIWYAPGTTLGEFFGGIDGEIVIGTGWDHIVTDDDDPTEPNPFKRITQRRVRPQKLPKMAIRWTPQSWVNFGNHDEHNHSGRRVQGLKYRHYQYRSFEQMCQKLRQGKEAFDATNLHPMYGTHWREGGAQTDAEMWKQWRRLCEEPGLTTDPAPIR